jgi:serine/threonine protein kinase
VHRDVKPNNFVIARDGRAEADSKKLSGRLGRWLGRRE